MQVGFYPFRGPEASFALVMRLAWLRLLGNRCSGPKRRDYRRVSGEAVAFLQNELSGWRFYKMNSPAGVLQNELPVGVLQNELSGWPFYKTNSRAGRFTKRTLGLAVLQNELSGWRIGASQSATRLKPRVHKKGSRYTSGVAAMPVIIRLSKTLGRRVARLESTTQLGENGAAVTAIGAGEWG